MQTPSTILKCVSFVGYKEIEDFLPRATCFYVGIVENGFSFFYVVTAEHVISKIIGTGEEVMIRNNREKQGFSDCVIPVKNWHFHPQNAFDQSDVAVAEVVVGSDDILVIALNGPNEMIADAKAIQNYNISIGDEVVVAGLFKNHHGTDRNVPIFRVGNIASLDCGKVNTSYCGYMDAFLIEIRSLGGISGSPVFVSMGLKRRMDGKIVDYTGPAQRIIGLIHGHFELENAAGDSTVEDGRAINVGIAVVTPISKVIDVVFSDKLIQKRDRSRRFWSSKGLRSSEEVIRAVNNGIVSFEEAFPETVMFSSASD